MTVGASIPAAVISMSILRGLLHSGLGAGKQSGAGHGLGGRVVGGRCYVYHSGALSAAGFLAAGRSGALSVVAASGIFHHLHRRADGYFLYDSNRRYLIVKEHGKLRYPEGTACAEVLMAGDKGGQSAGTVFAAIGVAGLFRVVENVFVLFKETVAWPVKILATKLSFDLLPSLMAVGFILGLETCGIVFGRGSPGLVCRDSPWSFLRRVGGPFAAR